MRFFMHVGLYKKPAKIVFNLCNIGWQWVRVDVQIVLVRSAGRAESRMDPLPEKRIFSVFSLLVEKYGLVICAIHMHVANIKLSLNFYICIV